MHLTGDAATIRRRMEQREHACRPLLQSQLDTLEPLEDDEPGFTVDVGAPLEDVVAEAHRRLGQPTR